MKRQKALSFLVPAAALAMLAGCAVPPPNSPTIMALPTAGKPLQVFQNEDYTCRQYASQYIAYPASQASHSSQNNGVASAAIGTGIGAAAGALFGAVAGNAGAGAAIGAGVGLLGGSAAGANSAQQTGEGLQQMYNTAYAQCMTSKGNGIAPPAYAVPVPVYGYYGY
jgi:Glycine-zipper domain